MKPPERRAPTVPLPEYRDEIVKMRDHFKEKEPAGPLWCVLDAFAETIQDLMDARETLGWVAVQMDEATDLSRDVVNFHDSELGNELGGILRAVEDRAFAAAIGEKPASKTKEIDNEAP